MASLSTWSTARQRNYLGQRRGASWLRERGPKEEKQRAHVLPEQLQRLPVQCVVGRTLDHSAGNHLPHAPGHISDHGRPSMASPTVSLA